MKTYTPTLRVQREGGNNRLRQMILYVAQRCADEEKFGVVKLNKILWKADFESYSKRRMPVTGVEYRKLPLGPAPKDMPDTTMVMRARGEIKIDGPNALSNEKRTIALVEPDMSLFDEQDIEFANQAISYYRGRTGNEASDDSHGAAWSSQNIGDLMPYQLADLSDKKLGIKQYNRLASYIEDEGMLSQ